MSCLYRLMLIRVRHSTNKPFHRYDLNVHTTHTTLCVQLRSHNTKVRTLGSTQNTIEGMHIFLALIFAKDYLGSATRSSDLSEDQFFHEAGLSNLEGKLNSKVELFFIGDLCPPLKLLYIRTNSSDPQTYRVMIVQGKNKLSWNPHRN